jgi:TolA-binding protein
MAKLGLAEAQARSGQFDQAINTFKDLAQRKDGPLPVDGILMQLGRTYLEAGKRADAQQTFNRIVEEYPESPFTGDARKELETLKKT